MINCSMCNKDFSSKASLSSHRYKFHKGANDTTPIVNNEIYRHENKKLVSLDSTSGESSTSDETIHPEFDPELDEGLEVVDEYNKYDEVDRYIKHLRHLKREHVSDSSDEEPEHKVPRKYYYNDELDDELEIIDEYNDGDEVGKYKKHLRHKRRHVSDSSDEEPHPKVFRKGDIDSYIDGDNGPDEIVSKRNTKRRYVSDSSDEAPLKKIRRYTARNNSSSDKDHRIKMLEKQLALLADRSLDYDLMEIDIKQRIKS